MADQSGHRFSLRKIIGYIIGPLLFLYIILFLDLEPGQPQVTYTLAVALLMAIWWITEIIPLAITALLPVVLFPLLGIMSGKQVSATYFNHVIFLFIGGFLIALAMQRWNLHKRIALKILMITGTSPARVLFGFMAATAFLSMWISNTATTMMMLPIVLSIIKKLEEHVDTQDISRYSVGLLLGVAYSASIGGVATLVGTPPNLSFVRILQIMFPEAPDISFSSWFLFAFPITLISIAFIWLFLYLRFKPKKEWAIGKGADFKAYYKELGPASIEEKIILIDFVLLAFLWLTRSGITIDQFVIPGWSSFFNHPEYFTDGTVAIAMSVILFFIPSTSQKEKYLMDWKTAKGIPWNIVLLFGGGFALATGFKESGLSMWFGEQLSGVAVFHPLIIIFIIAIGMTFLTELTSNTATTEMLLPVLAGLSVSIGIHPLLLMLPATISASMAFMLPVATPPNAIIFGSNKVTVMQMARTGFILNIFGAIIITLLTYYWGTIVFGFDPHVVPPWAMTN